MTLGGSTDGTDGDFCTIFNRVGIYATDKRNEFHRHIPRRRQGPTVGGRDVVCLREINETLLRSARPRFA